MNANRPKSDGQKTSRTPSNWDALFLKRADQIAFSTLWVAVILGCAWYFVTARGTNPIDIDQAKRQTTTFLVEINSASKHEFDCLPGIGPKTASAITSWRKEFGPFASLDSLAEVPGVSENMLEKLRPFLYFESSDEVAQKQTSK